MDHFSRLDRSDRNGPVPFDHSDPFSIPVPRCSVLSWRKTLIMQLLWTVNSGFIGVTRTSTCSYNRFVAASQVKRMSWLFTALKDDLFPEIFRHSKDVFELIW